MVTIISYIRQYVITLQHFCDTIARLFDTEENHFIIKICLVFCKKYTLRIIDSTANCRINLILYDNTASQNQSECSVYILTRYINVGTWKKGKESFLRVSDHIP